MKAITLKEPHAILVVCGIKKIETRSWSTVRHRGRVAIHASSAFDRWVMQACNNPIIRRVLCELGFDHAGKLPRGQVIGEVDLVDCLYMVDGRVTQPGFQFSLDDERLTPREREMGIYEPGRRAWILENARRYEAPVPRRGARGLWNYEPDPVAP